MHLRYPMSQSDLNSTFLIKSSEVKSMGTGFCVATDTDGAFLVTCTHVVEECGEENLEVNGEKAKLLHKGSSDDIDLALIYVKGLVNVEVLPLSLELKKKDTAVTLKGWKTHKKANYIAESVRGMVVDVTEIQSNNRIFHSYKLRIDSEDSIEKGNSGSAVICEKSGEVIAVATDRKSSGKQAYAIPISYLKEIWKELPEKLFLQPSEHKANFIHEVFDALDNNPLLLFSTDSYNHADYIETIRAEAIEIFQASHVIEINCGRYGNLEESDEFFSRLAKRLNFTNEVKDSFDFEDGMIEAFNKADKQGLKLFILIIGFERLQDEVRNSFAETLRNFQLEYSREFNLVLFGGKKLIELKYNNGVHSYFNYFDEKMIPPPSFEEWQTKFDYVTKLIYREILGVTGGYAKLTEHCFKAGVRNEEEAKALIDESIWKSDLFRLYKQENLCEFLSKETLGNAHPYSDNELLYKLYWDNLIIEEKGKFVWRSSFIVKLGKSFLGC